LSTKLENFKVKGGKGIDVGENIRGERFRGRGHNPWPTFRTKRIKTGMKKHLVMSMTWGLVKKKDVQREKTAFVFRVSEEPFKKSRRVKEGKPWGRWFT